MPAAFSCSFFSFREMKLQSFEFDLTDVIPTNVQIISHLVFFFMFSLILCGKKLLQGFMVFLVIFHELTKFWMIILCLWGSDVIHANEFI